MSNGGRIVNVILRYNGCLFENQMWCLPFCYLVGCKLVRTDYVGSLAPSNLTHTRGNFHLQNQAIKIKNL